MAAGGLRAVRVGRAARTTTFEVGFVHGEDVRCGVALSDAAAVPLEHVRPVRSFPAYQGQSS